MNRRTLLGGIGVSLAAGVAGCSGLGRADDETPTETAKTHTPPPADNPNADTGGDASAPDRPAQIHETVIVPQREAVPERISPHDLRLWNAVDSQRAVTATVTSDSSELLAELTTAHHVPAHEAVAIELRRPATYAVSVQIDGTPVGTLEIGNEWFDCNASATTVELGTDGIVDRRETSTLVACVDATVETPTADGE